MYKREGVEICNYRKMLRLPKTSIPDSQHFYYPKQVDKKMGGMITDKATSLMADVMTSVDAKQQKMMKTIEAKFNSVEKLCKRQSGMGMMMIIILINIILIIIIIIILIILVIW